MYAIHLKSPTTGAFFAAEELKKYLRMMMPRAGEIPIDLAPEVTSGFRLGLMSDFCLDTSDADDLVLDDIVYIDTDEKGGVIAGSNEGALLIAVYRYLKICGCRWLFPGLDGEYIPDLKELEPVKYRKKADHRYRGQCNEGAEFQQLMMESIEFTPKLGMNTYMIECDIPMGYYSRYYDHINNPNRKNEQINLETVLRWKRLCEVEIQKRGLHFHDMGHGWTAMPFGLDVYAEGIPTDIPPDVKARLALLKGKRDIYQIVLNTNFCMSSAENRDIVARYVADYAETQNNVDFLHVWLSDGVRNHCECDACREKTPTDWYIVLLNDIDAVLSERGLDTHLVFICYTDTFWAPKTEKLLNEKRFTMLYAPIFRKYTETYGEAHDLSAVEPFQLNQNRFPQGMGACLSYLDEWKKQWKGDCFCYEYHFWRQQYYDPSGLYLAKLLYEDVSALRSCGLDGIVEDGSQRSFFPTGLPYYVYGEMLFDSAQDFDTLVEDYFVHAFGKNWKEAYDYLAKIQDCLDFHYLSGYCSADEQVGLFYNPKMAEKLRCLPALVDEFEPVIEANLTQSQRVAHVSWSQLTYFGKYVKLLSEALALKAEGKDREADCALDTLAEEFGKEETYIQHNFDHFLAIYSLKVGIFNFKTRLIL